jgi:hypothetical protein
MSEIYASELKQHTAEIVALKEKVKEYKLAALH